MARICFTKRCLLVLRQLDLDQILQLLCFPLLYARDVLDWSSEISLSYISNFCTFTRFLLVLISFMGTSPSPRHGINHTYLFRFFFSFVSSSLGKHAPPPIQQLRATHAMQQLKFDGAYYRRPLVRMSSLPDPDASSVLLVSGLGLF